MDPFSITAACVGLLSGITALSQSLASFVTTARQARKDLDGFSRELSSLGLCIATLKDETFPIPQRSLESAPSGAVQLWLSHSEYDEVY